MPPDSLSLCSQVLLEEVAAFSYPTSKRIRLPSIPATPGGEETLSTDPKPSLNLNPAFAATLRGKKITLCCHMQTVERMEENSNTGSRKHDVSNSDSLSRQPVSAEGRFKESPSIRY
ncbi:MAG: hypothetical protein HY858_11160 [Candidatus Solibacter usitatus]|nr:hypothetical protein [Candidatus Solibacter usitatus]